MSPTQHLAAAVLRYCEYITHGDVTSPNGREEVRKLFEAMEGAAKLASEKTERAA